MTRETKCDHVRRYIEVHPNATNGEIAKAVGCSTALVSQVTKHRPVKRQSFCVPLSLSHRYKLGQMAHETGVDASTLARAILDDAIADHDEMRA